MALTRITKGVIKPNENYQAGIVTATGLDVNGNGDISGDLNVGGILTYEDVTSIDAVGIITAQKGIHVGAGISAVGVVTATTFKGDGDFVDIDVDGHTNLDNVSIAGVTTITSAAPELHLTDTNANSDYSIVVNGGEFRIRDETNSANRFYIASNGNSNFTGNVAITGGITNAQYLNLSALAPSIDFNDTNHNSDFMLQNANGLFKLYDNTNTADRVTVASDGKVSVKQDLDVDGHTELDNVNVAGVSTFSGNILPGTDSSHNIGSNGVRFANIYGDALYGVIQNTTHTNITRVGTLSQLAVSGTANPLNVTHTSANCVNLNRGGKSIAIDVNYGGSNTHSLINLSSGMDLRFKLGGTDKIVFKSAGHIEPVTDSQINLGSNTIRFANVYADTFVGALTGAASQVTATANGDNTAYRVPFTSAATGSASIYTDTSNGMTYNPSSGTLSATSFSGDGSNLTGITQTTINNNANNRLITGSGTANTLDAEAALTFYNSGSDPILTIENSGNPQLRLRTTGTTDNCTIDFGDADSVARGRIVYTNNGDNMLFYTNGTSNGEKLKLYSNGRLNLSPQRSIHADTMLHVEAPSSISSGETNVKFEGNATMGARLSLHNNNTSAGANNQLAFCDAGGQSTSTITGYNTDQTNNYGELVFSTRNAQGTPPEERLRIISSGNVGINEDNPLRKLHVKSGANNNDGAFRVESSSGNIMDMGTDGSCHFLNCVNNDPFRIKFAGNEAIRITQETSGNWTTTLQFMMETNNGQGATPYIRGVAGTESNGSDAENAGGLEFHSKTGGSGTDVNAMRISHNGRVSIGAHNVQAPSAALHIIGDTSGSNTAFQVGADGGARYFRLNEINGQSNFDKVLMSFYDNSLHNFIEMQNTYAGAADMGGNIRWIGHAGGETGKISVYNRDANSSSNSVMELRASYITKPSHPYFDVARSSGTVSATNVVQYNNVYINNGNHYNSSNGRFTAPVDGHYQFWYGHIKQNTNSVVRTKWRKNGGSYLHGNRELRLDDGGPNYGDNGAITIITYLNKNDYVEVVVTAGTIYGTAPEYGYACGTLLG